MVGLRWAVDGRDKQGIGDSRVEENLGLAWRSALGRMFVMEMKRRGHIA